MWTLDNFISPIFGFKEDLQILPFPVSAQSSGSESANDLSAGAGVGASKTQTGKCKAAATPIPQMKAKRAVGKSSSRIKINEHAPKASPAWTPSGSQQKISIHRSNRYTCYGYFLFLIKL
jgi:hypothetical protein